MMSDQIIDRLMRAEVFPHAVENIELLQTHISWVILTGDYAYKIKKPVNLGFVDYSTLDKRRRFCDLEVQLNRRYASEIYLGVVSIIEDQNQIRVCDVDSIEDLKVPVEYAVKMRQFSQDAIVAVRLENEELTAVSIEDFGRRLAAFHASIECANPTLECAQPEHVMEDVEDNFTVIKPLLPDDTYKESIEGLEKWTIDQTERISPKPRHRLAGGMVRRCHGDLHLKNMIQVDGEVHAFDGIEFNEQFQWIDILSELAFPVMDFIARGRQDLGWRLLNAWLEQTGDYLDFDLLRFYLVYRAMVRVKVTLLNPGNEVFFKRSSARELVGPWDKYIKTAEFFAFEIKPRLSITHGFSGTGKSTAAMKVIDTGGGIRIRTDVERHRLAGKFKIADKEKYSEKMNAFVYDHALQLAAAGIEAGFPIIVDGTFLKRVYRKRFIQLADQQGIDFQIIDCGASYDELCRRIQDRDRDASEATVSVLDKQMKQHDPLTIEELKYVR